MDLGEDSDASLATSSYPWLATISHIREDGNITWEICSANLLANFNMIGTAGI